MLSKIKKLCFGYSPCPNDTFVFYALAHQLIDTAPFEFEIQHHDIATLNHLAFDRMLDLTKISLFTYGHIRQSYALLPVGAALGKGYGPLVLTSNTADRDPAKWKIGLPGRYTTAHLLAHLWNPEMRDPVFLPFHRIITELAAGRLDAGIVIHESRFTYEKQGLVLHTDLGCWWQEMTQLPLPLGGICVSRTFSVEIRHHLGALIKDSLEYAYDHPQESLDYIKQHAQENDEIALRQHIDLYVNEYTKNLGEEGIEAVEFLLRKAQKLGLIPEFAIGLF
ncbi:MAG: 1,4-dihydroxy-6-naphthoate synthase [SAR324 cluster bacterium]|nr:1,4-dihydroxy-6-naphthoate synthase [SAR324 cluster bacterium]